MKSVILAAGEGTRLRPFTEHMPKGMLPMANRPILDHILNSLKKVGIKDIIMVAGYKKESIMNYFGEGKKFGVSITYVKQEKQIGTGHALLQAEKFIDDEFLVIPGDNIIDDKSISSVISHKGKNVILLEKSSTPSKYGVVDIKKDLIKTIREKPEHAETNIISTGVYKFSPSIFSNLKKLMKDGQSQITDTLQKLISQGEDIYGVKGCGGWMDIIYPWDMIEVNSKALQTIPKSTSGKIGKNVTIKGQVSIGNNTTIHSGSCITGPVIIGENCEIGPYTCIFSSSSIGNDVVMYPFSIIRNSILMEGVTIGSHSSINSTVVGKSTKISNYVSTLVGKSSIKTENRYYELESIGSFIGGNCEIKDHVTIEPGIIIGGNTCINPLSTINKNLSQGSLVM